MSDAARIYDSFSNRKENSIKLPNFVKGSIGAFHKPSGRSCQTKGVHRLCEHTDHQLTRVRPNNAKKWRQCRVITTTKRTRTIRYRVLYLVTESNASEDAHTVWKISLSFWRHKGAETQMKKPFSRNIKNVNTHTTSPPVGRQYVWWQEERKTLARHDQQKVCRASSSNVLLIVDHGIILVTLDIGNADSTLSTIFFTLQVEQQPLYDYIDELDIDCKVRFVRASEEIAANRIRHICIAWEEQFGFGIIQ